MTSSSVVLTVVLVCLSLVVARRNGGPPDPASASVGSSTVPDGPGEPIVFPVQDGSYYGGDSADGLRTERKRQDCVDNTLPYRGGPVLTNPMYINFIWYGTWTQAEKQIIWDWAHAIGNTQHWNINAAYTGSDPYFPGGTHVTEEVYFPSQQQADDDYSRGTALNHDDIWQIVLKAFNDGTLVHYDDTTYFVMTSGDVTIKQGSSGMCIKYCGWHTQGMRNGHRVLYSLIGNPEACLVGCAPNMNRVNSPNGMPTIDAMISVLTHELEEVATDPDVSTGYLDDCNDENADKCAWTFGDTWSVPAGGFANVRLGARDYMIQQNWRLPSNMCGMTVNGRSQNDECSTAIDINPGFSTTYGFNNNLATNSAQPSVNCSFSRDVWYRVYAQNGEMLTVTTCGLTNRDTVIGIYYGCGDTFAGCGNNNCGSQSTAYRLIVNTGYYFIRLGTLGGTHGQGQFKVQRVQSNDECNKAKTISAGNTYSFDTLDASTSTNPTNNQLCGGPIGRDLWYKYTALAGDQLTISTCGLTTTDTVIAVYRGSCNSSALAGCVDDSCGRQTTLAVDANTAGVYYFRLGGFKGSVTSGQFKFTVVAGNDVCSKAKYITEGSYSFNSQFGTTGSMPACGEIGRDLWYYAWAEKGETLRVSTCGLTSVDTVIAVYQNCSTQSYIACNDDSAFCGGSPPRQSQVSFTVYRSGFHYIRLGTYQGAIGSGSFRLDRIAPNDECAGALTVTQGLTYFDTVAASDSGPPENVCEGQSIRRDLWYSLVIPRYAHVTITTCQESAADTMLFLHPNCSHASTLACDDDVLQADCFRQSTIQYLSPNTQAYKLRVGTYTNLAATGDFNFFQTNDDCPAAFPLAAVVGREYTINYDTTIATRSLPLCGSGCTCANNDIWYVTDVLEAGNIFKISTCGGVTYDSVIQVGPSCENFTYCNDDDVRCANTLHSTVSFTVPATGQYFVRMGGYQSHVGGGSFKYHVRLSGDLALDFRPGSGYVYLTKPVTTLTFSITFSAWVVCNGTKSQNQILWYNGGVGTNGWGVVLGVSNTNVQLQVGNTIYASSYSLPLGRWTFLSIVLNTAGTQWQVYADGILQAVVNTPVQTTPASRFYLAGASTSTRFFNGIIDTLQVWNMGRVAAQLETDMVESALTGSEPGLLALVKCNDGIGVPVIVGASAASLGGFLQTGGFAYVRHPAAAVATTAIGTTSTGTTFDPTTTSGTTFDPTTSTATTAAAVTDLALDFRIATGYIYLTKPATTQTTGITLSCYVWVNGTRSGSQVILANGLVGTNGVAIVLSAGGLTVALQVGATQYPSTYALPIGQWVFLSVASPSAGNWRIFADGIFQAGVVTPALTTPTGRFYVAGQGTSSRYFNGLIDNVQVWTVYHDPELAGDMVEASLSGTESGLALFVPCNDGAGLPAIPGTGASLGPFSQGGTFRYAHHLSGGTTTTTTSSTGTTSTGTTSTGTTSTGSTTSTTGPSYVSTALDFRPNTGYLYLKSSASAQTTGITYSAWVYVGAVRPSAVFILYNGNPGTNGQGIQLRPSSSTVAIQTGADIVASTYSLPVGSWVFLSAVSATAAEWDIYANGVFQAHLTAGAAAVTPGTRFFVGGASSSSQYFNGAVDTVQIWNVARTPAQLANDMNEAAVSGFEADLAVYLPAQEGSGTTTAPVGNGAPKGSLFLTGTFGWVVRP